MPRSTGCGPGPARRTRMARPRYGGAMSVKVELGELAAKLADFDVAYLVTVSDDARSHVLSVWPEMTAAGIRRRRRRPPHAGQRRRPPRRHAGVPADRARRLHAARRRHGHGRRRRRSRSPRSRRSCTAPPPVPTGAAPAATASTSRSRRTELEARRDAQPGQHVGQRERHRRARVAGRAERRRVVGEPDVGRRQVDVAEQRPVGRGDLDADPERRRVDAGDLDDAAVGPPRARSRSRGR